MGGGGCTTSSAIEETAMGNKDLKPVIITGRATLFILFMEEQTKQDVIAEISRLFYHEKLDMCQPPTFLQRNAAKQGRADWPLPIPTFYHTEFMQRTAFLEPFCSSLAKA